MTCSLSMKKNKKYSTQTVAKSVARELIHLSSLSWRELNTINLGYNVSHLKVTASTPADMVAQHITMLYTMQNSAVSFPSVTKKPSSVLNAPTHRGGEAR